MKKVFLFLNLLLSLGMLGACSNDEEENTSVSQNQAWERVKMSVLNNQLDNINVYVSKNTIQPNTIVETYGEEDKSPNYESWLFFIDDIPYGNWGHPCRYVYVNIVGGNYEVHDNSMPPKSLGNYITLVEMPLEIWNE
ncbi:MAG: hypothetical protein IJ190_03320 [Prevotella sp.]|nr:hypothetical protein [Prevotella sp.]